MPESRNPARARRALFSASLAGAVALISVLALAPYPDEPPVAHTGGFGEPTCHRCHFDKALNGARGGLSLSGIGDSYVPGRHYTLTVTVTHPELQRAGFQLACRFAGEGRAGTQAGTLRAGDANVVVQVSERAVQYAQHTGAGSVSREPGLASWMVEWIAPTQTDAGPIALHLVANAANGDDSEFGDHVYREERLLAGSR